MGNLLSLEVTWLLASEPFLLLGLGGPGCRRNSLLEFSSGFLDISELFQVSVLSSATCGVDEGRNQEMRNTPRSSGSLASLFSGALLALVTGQPLVRQAQGALVTDGFSLVPGRE